MADKVVGDFSGGISGLLWSTPENSAADIVNMTPWAGRLAASAGFGAITTADWPKTASGFALPAGASDLIGGLSNTGSDWMILRRGSGLYAMGARSLLSANVYPLFRLAKRTDSDSSDKAIVVGDYVYIAPDKPGDSEYVLRWDKKIIFGTCNWQSADYSTSLINYLVADPVAAHGSEALTTIRPGMQFQWIDDNGATPAVYTYSDPVAITHVLTSDCTQIRIAGTTAPAHPTTGHFIITSIERIGIPAPLSAPYTIGWGHTTTAMVDGNYRYQYRFKSSLLNTYSAPSPISAIAECNDSNNVWSVVIKPSPTVDRGEWTDGATGDYLQGEMVHRAADPTVHYVCIKPDVHGSHHEPGSVDAGWQSYWVETTEALATPLPSIADQIEIYRSYQTAAGAVWTPFYLWCTLDITSTTEVATWTTRKAWTSNVHSSAADAIADNAVIDSGLEWSSAADYTVGTRRIAGGIAYVALQNSGPGGVGAKNPATETAYWGPIAGQTYHDLTDTLPSDAYWHTQPAQLGMLTWHQGRLFGVDPASPGTLKFSTLGYPESFPLIVFTSDATEVYYGGSVDVGQRGEIQAISAEGASFGVSGISGDNLLIFSTGGVYRFSGTSWSDFNLMGGFRYDGCAPRSVVNVGGMTVFMGERRVYGIEQGSSHPVALSDGIWPEGRYYGNRTWCAAYFDGMYVLANEETVYDSGSPFEGEAFAMNLNTKAWVKISGQACVLCPNLDDYYLFAGVNKDYGLRSLYSDASTPWKIITRPELLVTSYGGIARKKMVRRIWFAITGAATITPSLYVDGSTSPAWTADAAIAVTGAGVHVVMVPVETGGEFCPVSGYMVSVGLTGAADVWAGYTPAPTILVDWIRLECDDLKENKTRT